MDSTNEEKKTKDSGHAKSNNKKKTIIAIVSALVVVCCVAGYFVYDQYFKPTVISDEQLEILVKSATYSQGISIDGIDISGKTYEEAKSLVVSAEEDKIESIKYTLKNDHGTVEITGADFAVTFDTEDVLKQALKFGREGNAFDKTYAKEELQKGKNFSLTMTIDKETTLNNIDAKVATLSKAAEEPSISISSNQNDLVFKDGSAGYSVDIEALNALITTEIDAGNSTVTVIVPTTEVQPTQSLAELKQYSSLISEYKTTYAGSAGRKSNVVKAAGLMNGTKVEPGQSVSVNDVLGPRVAGKGWSLAPAILEGVHVDELGGGVCQVSSTLYNALLMADVTIIQRSPHTEKSAYVPIGRDATISTGGPDLVFRNDNDHAIFIFAITDTKKSTLTFKIYGEPLDDGVSITLTSSTIATLQPTSEEVVIVDPTKPAGYNEVVIARRVGYKSQTFKKYIKDGKVIKTVLVTTDTYPAKAGKRIVGPEATPTPTLAPTPTPSPTPTP